MTWKTQLSNFGKKKSPKSLGWKNVRKLGFLGSTKTESLCRLFALIYLCALNEVLAIAVYFIIISFRILFQIIQIEQTYIIHETTDELSMRCIHKLILRF